MATPAARAIRKSHSFSALVCVSLSAAALGQSRLVDFDTLTGMNNAPGSSVPAASRLAQLTFSDAIVKFSSDAPFVAVVRLTPFTTSIPNGLGGTSAAGALSYEEFAPIDIAFFDPADASTPWVSNRVSVRPDTFPLPGEVVKVQAFGIAGELLASVDVPNPSPGGVLCEIAVPGIHRFRFIGTGTTAIDDLSFELPTPPADLCAGDLTADGFVDDSDFVIFAAAYDAFSIPPANPAADLTGDGFVDDSDFVIFAAAYEDFLCD